MVYPAPFDPNEGNLNPTVGGDLALATSLHRIVVAQTDVCFTDEFLRFLTVRRVGIFQTATPDGILQQLDASLENWEVIIYSITRHWQKGLDFARQVRRIRERHGGRHQPIVLILAFQEHLPTTIYWFRQTSGTRYVMFTGEAHFLMRLREIQQDLARAKQAAHRLHLRLVHGGNPSGVGCIAGERLVAIYGSFQAGAEREIAESEGVLNFVNLLGMNHWRFRSKREILHLMNTSPFYVGNGMKGISANSVKTYIARVENAVRVLWGDFRYSGEPPMLIARQARGNKEVAYRLLCNCEIDHI